MTSLLFSLLALEVGAMPTDVYAEQTYSMTADGKTTEVKYRLHKPAKIEEGKTYPVVLFLHGAGERGDDNQAQLKYFPEWMADAKNREKFPCFVIAPQCPTGKRWGSMSFRRPTDAEAPKLPKESSEQTKIALGMLDEVLKKHPADAKRVYLTGLSMGGYGSWEIAVRYPDRFAAVVPICGGGDESESSVEKLKDIPIWAWHGDKDEAVPVERSRRMIEAIKKAGGKPKYTELKDVGHDSWTAAYTSADNIIPWMFEQKKK